MITLIKLKVKLNINIIKNLYNIVYIKNIDKLLLFEQYLVFSLKYILQKVQKVTPWSKISLKCKNS